MAIARTYVVNLLISFLQSVIHETLFDRDYSVQY